MKFGVLSLAATAGLALSADPASAQWVAGQQPYGYSVIVPAGGYPLGGYSNNLGGFSNNGFYRAAPAIPSYSNGPYYNGVTSLFATPGAYTPLSNPNTTILNYGVPFYGTGIPSYYYRRACAL